MSLRAEKFAIVVCKGEMRSEDDLTELSNQVSRCGVDEEVKAVILVINAVSFINTRSLGQLISSHTKLKNQGARLCLVGIQNRVYETLQITNLLNSFEYYNSINEAVAALSVE